MSSFTEVPAMTPSIVNSTSGGADGMGGMGFVGGLVLASLFKDQNQVVNNMAIAQAQQTGILTTEITGLGNNINQGFNTTNTAIMSEGRQSDSNLFNATTSINGNINCSTQGINKSLCALGHSTQQGLATTNFNIAVLGKDIQLQGQKDTCTLLNAIAAEGAATRDLIQETTTQNLRDELAAERRTNDRQHHDNSVGQLSVIINNLQGSVASLYNSVNQIKAAS